MLPGPPPPESPPGLKRTAPRLECSKRPNPKAFFLSLQPQLCSTYPTSNSGIASSPRPSSPARTLPVLPGPCSRALSNPHRPSPPAEGPPVLTNQPSFLSLRICIGCCCSETS